MNCPEAMAGAAPSASGPSPLEKPLSQLTEEDIAQVTREDCRRFLKDRGMRRPSWNKSQAIQQVISLKALLEGRPAAGDPPVPSFLLPYSKSPHATTTPSHDAHRARSLEKNETSGSGSGQQQQQTKEPSMPSPYRRRDRDPVPPPPPVSSDPPPENRPAMDPLPGQLTIFYDGHISVYEGVSPDKAKAIMQLAESSADHYPVPMSTAQAIRPPPPKFPSSFPGSTPGGSMPSTSPTGGSTKMPRIWREISTEEAEMRPPPRENDAAEEPTTRKASLQRYLEKRKDRIKGKGLQRAVPGTSMDMMYNMSHKSMWCHTSNETEPRSPPVTIQCGSQNNHPTKVCLSFDLNDKAVEE